MQATMERPKTIVNEKEEFAQEIQAMFSVCFNGKSKRYADGVRVFLSDGREYFLKIITLR